MIRDDVELHNVAAVTEREEGLRLERLPGDVRRELNEKARGNYLRPSGSEIRFVGDGPVEVTLSCPDGRCEATPHYGTFVADPDDRVEIGSEPTTVELAVPDRLTELEDDIVDGMAFPPRVCRLVLRGNPTLLRDVSGDARPTRETELPDRRYLAYGTSITQGAVASSHDLTYVGGTARRLGADLLNLGTGGSAFCEPELADHVAGRDDWDVATLAVSVNMIAADFSPETFRERASYLIETVADAHPEKPVVPITLYPVFPDLRSDPAPEGWAAEPETYRTVLREVVAAADRENVHLLEGRELLSDPSGLSPDLVHPTDHGMIEIAERLAPELEALLEA